MSEQLTQASIVVGIDGSRTAVRAALWAIDEAVSRDSPLQLVAAANSPAERAEAELAVRSAAAAVEATGRLVDLETHVLDGEPTPILLKQSGTAAMVCVGAVGRRHFDRNRVGSTTGALVAAAHCPIAVVRGGARSDSDPGSWVVVELDETPDSAAVLQFGVAEARLRNAPLRVPGNRAIPISTTRTRWPMATAWFARNWTGDCRSGGTSTPILMPNRWQSTAAR